MKSGFKLRNFCIIQFLAITITHVIYFRINNIYEVREVSLEILEALSKICHENTINGVSDSLLNHFIYSIKDHQRVVCNDQISNLPKITSAVTQDSLSL